MKKEKRERVTIQWDALVNVSMMLEVEVGEDDHDIVDVRLSPIQGVSEDEVYSDMGRYNRWREFDDAVQGARKQ